MTEVSSDTTSDSPKEGQVLWVVPKDRFDNAERICKMIASVAAILGIFFAAQQFSFSTANAIRQTSLEVLRPTHDTPFVGAARRLLTAQATGTDLKDLLTSQYVEDIELLLNTYDIIAIHYEHGTIDKCLVKTYTGDALKQLIPMFEFAKLEMKTYARIARVAKDVETLGCRR